MANTPSSHQASWNQMQWPQQGFPQQFSPAYPSAPFSAPPSAPQRPMNFAQPFNQAIPQPSQKLPQLPNVPRTASNPNQQFWNNASRQGQQAIANTGVDRFNPNAAAASVSRPQQLPQSLQQASSQLQNQALNQPLAQSSTQQIPQVNGMPDLATMLNDPAMQQLLQDPKMQQVASQLMQNGGLPGMPNAAGGAPAAPAEAMESMIPDPASALTGMAIAVPTAIGLTKLAQPENFARITNGINGVPGIQVINNFMDDVVNNKLLNSRLGQKHATRIKAGLTTLPPKELEKLMANDIMEAAGKKYSRVFEARPELMTDLKKMVQASDEPLKALSTELSAGKFSQEFIKANETLSKSYRKGVPVAKLVGKGTPDGKLLGGVKNYTKGQTHVLERYSKRFAQLNPEFASKGAVEGLSLGRSVKSMFSHLEGIFSGDALKESGMGRKMLGMTDNAAASSGGLKSFLPKLLGPAFMGLFVFGFPLMQAKKAEEGEKTKTFFHGLLGEQLGLFMGWEMARSVLRGTGVVGILLKGVGVSRFMLKGSPAGFAVELAAMLLLSKPFQKAGESIAHMIFGKPKGHEEAGKKKAPNLPLTLDPSQVASSRNEEVFKPFNENYHQQLHRNERPNQPRITAKEISQSFSRQEHDETANAVISDIMSRWPDDNQIIPVEIASAGGDGGH